MDCHGETPHKIPTYNRHTKRVACETCHVPVFAKGLPTKVWWDWSKAGQDRPPAKDKYGLETYVKIKGEFKWEKDVPPTYLWYNGETARYLLGDTIDPSKAVALNKPLGDRKDVKARIMPFKVMRGKQPYDKAVQDDRGAAPLRRLLESLRLEPGHRGRQQGGRTALQRPVSTWSRR